MWLWVYPKGREGQREEEKGRAHAGTLPEGEGASCVAEQPPVDVEAATEAAVGALSLLAASPFAAGAAAGGGLRPMDGACTPATMTLMGWKSGSSVRRSTLPLTTCSTMPGSGLSRLVCSISSGSKPTHVRLLQHVPVHVPRHAHLQQIQACACASVLACACACACAHIPQRIRI